MPGLDMFYLAGGSIALAERAQRNADSVTIFTANGIATSWLNEAAVFWRD